jgi:leucyl-tRNA synthetase
MRFRDALISAYRTFTIARDFYRDYCEKMGISMHAEVIQRYLEVQWVLMAPITPHFCEFMWGDASVLGRPGFVVHAPWPAVKAMDESVLDVHAYLEAKIHSFRNTFMKQIKDSVADRKKHGYTYEMNIYVATAYVPWQQEVINLLNGVFKPGQGFAPDAFEVVKKTVITTPTLKPLVKRACEFAANVIKDAEGKTDVPAVLKGQ